MPLGDFFGASFGRPRRLVSDRLVIDGGGYLCRFEMPFNVAARIELHNDSPRTASGIFFQIGYYEEPGRSATEATFHATCRRESVGRNGPPFLVLNAAGRGWFAGMTLDVQNGDWWLRPPWRDVILPRGFGLGLLEGWETVVVDAEDEMMGTGAEDYFSGGFYFDGGRFCTGTHGCTRRSFLTGRVSAYRFHVDDPIPFERSLEVRLDHGLENSMAGEYRATAFWYQLEPHREFTPLPSAVDRVPRMPIKSPLQWALCALATAAGAALASWLLW